MACCSGLMVIDKIKELKATQAKALALQEAIDTQLTQELGELPEKYGFDSMEAFIKAVKQAAGKGRKAGKKPKGKKDKAAGDKPRRARAVITDATRAEVKRLVEEGKTGAEIAKAAGISLPSVQNIKKALGLVKKD
jgi:DNA-binding NarL/FixJ family response regulator